MTDCRAAHAFRGIYDKDERERRQKPPAYHYSIDPSRYSDRFYHDPPLMAANTAAMHASAPARKSGLIQ